MLSIIAWWPSTLLFAAYQSVRLGPSRQKACGKTPWRQFMEQIEVAAKWMVPPMWYYTFEFFDDERRAHAGEYLQRVQTKPFILAWLVDRVNRRYPRFPFASKLHFAALCRQNALPTCDVIAFAKALITWSWRAS